MKIVVYGPLRRVGVLDGPRVIDANGAFAKYAGRSSAKRRRMSSPRRWLHQISATSSMLDRGRSRARTRLSSISRTWRTTSSARRGEALIVPVEQTKLHPPLASRASRIMNLGNNFADHVRDYRLHRLRERVTIEQVRADVRAQGLWGFYKIAACAIGTDEDLVYPDHTEQLDYEGEVALVFGRQAKSQRAEVLDAYVWGFTLQNDWSIRDQVENPLSGYAMAKNFDGSASLGPCIVVNEIDDPQDVSFETHVNDELRQRGSTRDMIFSFGEAFEYLTRGFTIQPGDILSAGTSAGTAVDSPASDGSSDVNLGLFAKPGDSVEVSSPSIGTLRNRVVAPGGSG